MPIKPPPTTWHCPKCQWRKTVSPKSDALQAKQNATKNGVKIDVLCGDMYEPIKKKKYNMIISNPPYIKSGVIPSLMPEVKDFEPLDALDGGVDGLEFYRRIVKDAPQHLKKNGLLVFEIGHDQVAEVTAIITVTDKFEEVKIGVDLRFTAPVAVSLAGGPTAVSVTGRGDLADRRGTALRRTAASADDGAGEADGS